MAQISYSFSNYDNNKNTIGHCLGVNSLYVDHKRSLLYSGGRDSSIMIWDFNNIKENVESSSQTFLVCTKNSK